MILEPIKMKEEKVLFFLDKDEKKEFAQNDNFATSQDIMKLIQNKTIEPTPNILRYRDLLFAMENIQKDFSQNLTI